MFQTEFNTPYHWKDLAMTACFLMRCFCAAHTQLGPFVRGCYLTETNLQLLHAPHFQHIHVAETHADTYYETMPTSYK